MLREKTIHAQTFRPDDYYNGQSAPGKNRYAGAGRSSNGKMPFWALESETAERGSVIFFLGARRWRTARATKVCR